MVYIRVKVRVRVSISYISMIKTLLNSIRKRQQAVVRNGIDCYKWHRPFIREIITSALPLVRPCTFQETVVCVRNYLLHDLGLNTAKTNCEIARNCRF